MSVTPWQPTPLDAVAEVAARDGFVVLPGLLPPDVIDPLARAVDGWITDLGWMDGEGRPLTPTPAYDADDFVQLQQWAYPSPELTAVRQHPALWTVVEALLGGPVEGGHGDLVRVQAPGDPPDGTPPHQDAFYVQRQPRLWTVWIAIVPTPVEMGPIAVWPGSQLEGVRPHHGEGVGTQGVVVPDEAWWASGDLMPGDVVAFDRLTVHRTLPNRSGRMRRSVDLRFVPATLATV